MLCDGLEVDVDPKQNATECTNVNRNVGVLFDNCIIVEPYPRKHASCTKTSDTGHRVGTVDNIVCFNPKRQKVT
jgi:hypothetical protein